MRVTPLGALATLASVTSAGVVAVVATIDRERGAMVGMAAAGLVALVSGTSVIVFSWKRGWPDRATEWSRALLGIGVTIWGLGQFLISLQMTPTGQRTFGIGDVISSLCLPVLLLALIRMPRQSRISGPTVRLVLDALALTATVTLTIWWLVLQPALPDPARPPGGAVSGTIMASFDTGVAAMTALIWVRDHRRGCAAVAAGLTLQAIADISSMPAVLSNSPLPWMSGAIWCIALPLLAAGIITYAANPVTSVSEIAVEDLGESRATIASTIISLVVLGVALCVPVEHRWTGIAVVLFAIAGFLLVIREIPKGIVHNRTIQLLLTEALRDVITGLPNRSALTARIRSLDQTKPWVLLTVDLDNFKNVNDQLGPREGDTLIERVGAALQDVSGPDCLVARMDGDKFGVLSAGTVADGEQLARRLSSAVCEVGVPNPERNRITLSAGIGIGRVTAGSEKPPAGEDDNGAVLLQDHQLNAIVESEAALRSAKRMGRGHIDVYPGAVEQERRKRLRLERRLKSAIENEMLVMYAQPVVNLHTGRTVGFESLARWTDPHIGPVSPADFVPVAEEIGLITQLGDFALRSTLEQVQKLGLAGAPVEVGVNVSPTQLRDQNFAAIVKHLVDDIGLADGQLLLEITEEIGVDEDDIAVDTIRRLSDAGILIAIDDFGTGYSALSYLRWLPVNMIKIDRSWVVASVHDRRTRDIVQGVVTLAHKLDATVVMEGIEDEDTAQVCRDLGAHRGQGWHFGRPAPWGDAVRDRL